MVRRKELENRSKKFLEMKNILVWMRGFLVADRWNLFMGRNNYEKLLGSSYIILSNTF